jgi:two-component system, NarL family, sensor histidine kinase UhpB
MNSSTITPDLYENNFFVKKSFIYTLLAVLFISLEAYGQTSNVDSLKTLLASPQEDTLRSQQLRLLSWTQFEKGEIDDAKIYANELLALTEADRYKNDIFWIKAKTYALNVLGIIDASQGKYRDAIKYQTEALSLRKQIGDKGNIANSLMNLGIDYWYLGQYPEALTYYLEALTIFDELKDSTGIADINNNIGGIYEHMLQFDQALSYYQTSLQIRLLKGDKEGTAECYNNIGNIYDYQKKYQASLDNHFKALQIHMELENKEGIAIAKENIANTYSNMGNYEEELKYREASLSINKELGNQQGIATSYNSIGFTFNQQKKYALALDNYQEGLRISKSIGSTDRMMDAYQGLATSNAGLKQYEKAYSYHIAYTDLRDTLLNKENQNQMADMKEKYESEKKDAQISLLHKNAELLQEKNKRRGLIRTILIIASIIVVVLLFIRYRVLNALQMEKMRNRISKDLHDDIGSTLSSISIYSSAVERMKADQFPEVTAAVSHIGRSARTAMENMSDIVWAINPANDTFQNMMNRLQIFAIRLLETKDIELQFEIPEVLQSIKLSMTQRKNIYLILREAIHNVAKYSRATHCVVSAKLENKKIGLEVMDDGIGFSDIAPGLGGNGLVNMQERADELKANIQINSENQKGTRVSLQFSYH